jgi:uracil phosphoribosyltransferase
MSPNVIVPNLKCLLHLFTKIRDKNTNKVDFVQYSKRLMSIICEEGLFYVGNKQIDVETPTNSVFTGHFIDHNNIVVVSIIRAGKFFNF